MINLIPFTKKYPKQGTIFLQKLSRKLAKFFNWEVINFEEKYTYDS